jgi:hypothetical protein
MAMSTDITLLALFKIRELPALLSRRNIGIRKNLEGFQPLTISKAKPESERFFKLIMGLAALRKTSKCSHGKSWFTP